MYRQGYEDILSSRREERSNWLWVSRALNTKVAVEIKPRPSPESHKEAVLHSPKIQELIEETSKKENVSKQEVQKQIQLILEEIGFRKNLKIIRFLGYTLAKIYLNVHSGIYVNYEGILEIKSKMGTCPVIFVPSHRSYADFIIFSYVCFHYDIEIPAVAAGMDFHGMMGMGEVLRSTGAFFMRRSYNDDSMYWTTFKEYVNQIIAKGDLPIEFFIEGTRSRSNKSIVPKYGLFNMILKAFFLAQVPDMLFVPVSINYDRILEEHLFAYELLGIPKPKESTSGFIKSLKLVKESFGNIYFHVGEPISAKQFFSDKLNREAHAMAPIHLHEITEQEKHIIPPLAYEIVSKQQLFNPLGYFNLISFLLNNNVLRGQKFMNIKELMTEIKVLKSALQSWDARIFEQDIEKAIQESLEVHKNLISCGEDETIELVTNQITIDPINLQKFKAHSFSEATITSSVPFVMLQIYANPVLHYLVDPALVVTILKSGVKMRKEDLFGQYCTLRAIFSFEFVLPESMYKVQFEKALVRLTSSGITVLENDEYKILNNSYVMTVLLNSIQTFMLTYYVVAEVLLTGPESIDEKSALASVQKFFEDIISKKQIFVHPYCMTLDCLTNCLNSLNKMNIAKKSRKDGKISYQINQEVVKFRDILGSYIAAFESDFETFLHVKSKI